MAKLLLINTPETGRRFTVIHKNRLHITVRDATDSTEYTIEVADFRERDHMLRYTDEQWDVWVQSARFRMRAPLRVQDL